MNTFSTTTPVSPVFQAAWPPVIDPALKSSFAKITQLAQRLLAIPFFLLVKVRRSLRDLACQIIMPGPRMDISEAGDALLREHGGERVVMRTPDGVDIEGALFRAEKTDRVALISGGNMTSWEVEESWIELLRPLGISVMLFSPRGIGNSGGKRCTEGWALDCYTVAEWLFNTGGFSPDKCLPMGFSLGASTTARGAALIQSKYPDVSIPLLNICSFSSLDAQISGMLWWPVAKVVQCILHTAGVSIPAASALNLLKGERVVMYRPNDEVIPAEGSMARATVAAPRTRCLSLDPDEGHSAPMTPAEVGAIRHEVCRLLDLKGNSPQMEPLWL